MGNKVELKKQVTPDRYYLKVILEDLLNYYFPKEVGRFNLEMRNEQWVYFATRALTEDELKPAREPDR
ncbi:hypothetical protein FOMG_18251 [Fusarium oxysporum f. sp. melonis 26406]|uniref:Uncharacterized protein n=1 Tax=Fusarium oxysporum f. sp. melonis 26406 TaxID=1089452 RepID=W9Z9Z2_FUSOX|nr:hypothetical protein FOMG_18251 [Fusarium oxysporum f. sp. melonis 26406]